MYLIVCILIIVGLLVISEMSSEKESLSREKIRLDKDLYLKMREKNGHSRISQ